MNRGTFLQRFPEFAEAGDLIDSALAQADREISDTVTTRRDDLVGLAAAHILATSPFGRDARLSSVKGESVYSARLDAMREIHAVGRFRLA